MANNRRAEEIKIGISERIGLLDRDVTALRADIAAATTALAAVKGELRSDIALTAARTDGAVRDLKVDLKSDLTELRSDFKELKSELRTDLKDAIAQIRSDLAERHRQASSSASQ